MLRKSTVVSPFFEGERGVFVRLRKKLGSKDYKKEDLLELIFPQSPLLLVIGK
jgi:hypothetical protein